jgi:integrase
VARMVRRVGRKAGVERVHPHQLRHTCFHPVSTEACASKRSPSFSDTAT